MTVNDQDFDLLRFWHEGGFTMYPILLLALAAEAAAVAGVVSKNAKVALVALALATLPLTMGVLGRAYNRTIVDQALAAVSPADHALLKEVGYAESDRPLQLGGVATLFTLPTAIAAYVLSRKREAPVVRLR